MSRVDVFLPVISYRVAGQWTETLKLAELQCRLYEHETVCESTLSPDSGHEI